VKTDSVNSSFDEELEKLRVGEGRGLRLRESAWEGVDHTGQTQGTETRGEFRIHRNNSKV
jgi:hypothetical protein